MNLQQRKCHYTGLSLGEVVLRSTVIQRTHNQDADREAKLYVNTHNKSKTGSTLNTKLLLWHFVYSTHA
jgi:hypothetical protein